MSSRPTPRRHHSSPERLPGAVDSGDGSSHRIGNRDLWNAWTRSTSHSAFYDVASFRTGENGNPAGRLRAGRSRSGRGAETSSTCSATSGSTRCRGRAWVRTSPVPTSVTRRSRRPGAGGRGRAPGPLRRRRPVRPAGPARRAFDIVYTSRGVLGWLPDIEGWARVAAHFVEAWRLPVHHRDPSGGPGFENEGVEPGELRLAYPYWSHQEPLDLRGPWLVRRPERPDRRPRRVRLGSFAGRDRQRPDRSGTAPRVPARVRLRRLAGRVPGPQ